MLSAMVTFTGNVVYDPEVRETKAGRVTSFKVAATERYMDDKTKNFVDGVTTFYRVSCWRTLGDRVAATLRQGDPVLVAGRLAMHTFERKDGGQGFSLEVKADAVGPDLRLAKVEIYRRAREVTTESVPVPTSGEAAPAASDDPWANDIRPAAEPAA
jgi:single-strand DNA-binding protein